MTDELIEQLIADCIVKYEYDLEPEENTEWPNVDAFVRKAASDCAQELMASRELVEIILNNLDAVDARQQFEKMRERFMLEAVLSVRVENDLALVFVNDQTLDATIWIDKVANDPHDEQDRELERSIAETFPAQLRL